LTRGAERETTPAMTTTRDRLLGLIRTRSFATGDFTLASGKKSSLYFNLKPTMMHPDGAHLLGHALLDAIEGEPAAYIGGLELGAVPLVTTMAAASAQRGAPLPAFFVRKKAKEYGAKALIEGLGPGESLSGQRVVAVEDTSTTGGSLLQAIAAVREAGGIVEAAVTVIDRQEGASEALAAEGVRLLRVFTAAEIAGGGA
jgi:orotate phosphoribosyltransferase